MHYYTICIIVIVDAYKMYKSIVIIETSENCFENERTILTHTYKVK